MYIFSLEASECEKPQYNTPHLVASKAIDHNGRVPVKKNYQGFDYRNNSPTSADLFPSLTYHGIVSLYGGGHLGSGRALLPRVKTTVSSTTVTSLKLTSYFLH